MRLRQWTTAHIIPIYEAGEADGVLFIAMRFVDGTDLKGLLGMLSDVIAGGNVFDVIRDAIKQYL